MHVRRATDDDWPTIWPIWREVVRAGETYLWSTSTTEAAARRLWMLPPPAEVWVVEDGDRGVAGSAVLKPIQPGLGDHVANASFMVDARHRGRGAGRALAEAVLARAAEAGYDAMQFNAVVATNTSAIALWRSLGFAIVGRLPEAFRHRRFGKVDLLVMYRRL